VGPGAATPASGAAGAAVEAAEAAALAPSLAAELGAAAALPPSACGAAPADDPTVLRTGASPVPKASDRTGAAETRSPARPSVVSAPARGRPHPSPGAPKSRSRLRRPRREAPDAASGDRRKSRVRTGAGRMRVAAAIEMRSACRAAHSAQRANCASALSRSTPSVSPAAWAAIRRRSWSTWSRDAAGVGVDELGFMSLTRRYSGRPGSAGRRARLGRAADDQPRKSSMRSSSRSRNPRRPRWIRDFTVPNDTPVISAISA
jgi:hypothetical protein